MNQINKHHVFKIFRKLANIFYGCGLRDRFELIDRLFRITNRWLAPNVTHVRGHVMYLDWDDSMGLAVAGEYQPAETRLILDLIQPGQIALDIGANIGYYTLILAELVGPSGHVYSFEPDPYSFELLARNIAANHYVNVSAFQMAVSNEDQELLLYRSRFRNLDHRIVKFNASSEAVSVRAVKLDSFLPELLDRDISFIKMDIQGAEGLALEGMRRIILESSSLHLFTEYWPAGLEQTGYGGDRYLESLSTLGFELIDLREMGEDGSLPDPISIAELRRMYPPSFTGHTNILCNRIE